MVVPPFLVSELCPFDNCKKKSCKHHNSVIVIYLHETLKECVSGYDKVSGTIMVLFHFCFRVMAL